WEWFLQRVGKKAAAGGPWGSWTLGGLCPRSMLPDVVDDFRLQKLPLKGLETIFYSSYVFFTKLSGAGALGISTLSLDFAGYESGACKQSEPAVLALKVLIGAVPTSMVLLGLAILSAYPITEQRRQETARELDALRWAAGADTHGPDALPAWSR
uniref:Major facilitator superfamily domain containing 2B n=1 Tax=Sarcophilus harrisii TaxID=9305 RepID=A0A7N4V1Y5_SARHA